jgi:hypothetical protein
MTQADIQTVKLSNGKEIDGMIMTKKSKEKYTSS